MATSEQPGIRQEQIEARLRAESQDVQVSNANSEDQTYEQQEKVLSYLENYPNAIVNRDTAEYAAYASKINEERVVEYRRDAIGSAEKAAAVLNNAPITIGPDRPRSSDATVEKSLGSEDQEQMELYIRSANVAADHAKWARAKADKQAEIVGSIFDKVKDL